MKYVKKHVWKEHLCAHQVFLCALVSLLVCVCTRTQLRGNIASDSSTVKKRKEQFSIDYRMCLKVS